MAANYWDSTQARYWTFTKVELADHRKAQEKANQPLYNKFQLPDRRLLNIYFQQQITKLGRKMGLRQQPLVTAQAYLKRFYIVVEMRKTNPYLTMATAIYLACKMEECPQHIRLMLGEAARHWPELGVTESSKIGECEFAMISTLSSRLICHHPFRTLLDLGPGFGLSSEETQLAWSIINDSYNTDLLLLHPPHIIAITAIFLAVVLRPSAPSGNLQAQHGSPGIGSPGQGIPSPSTSFSPAMSATAAQQAAFLGGFGGLKQAGPKLSKLVDWLAESKVDMTAIVDATQEMISLYDVWETYSERACKESITKFIKEGGLVGNNVIGGK